MKQAFNIYPALFILTPIDPDDVHSGTGEKKWTNETARYFTSCPHTYWGNCIFNAARTRLTLSLNGFSGLVYAEVGEDKLQRLEPAKFRGTHYIITYLPVSN